MLEIYFLVSKQIASLLRLVAHIGFSPSTTDFPDNAIYFPSSFSGVALDAFNYPFIFHSALYACCSKFVLR